MDHNKRIEELQKDLINDIIDVCSIDSAYDSKTEKKGMPFGQGARKALDWMLEKGRKDGYEVHDVDGYAGDIEIGEGEEGLSILGHLDVVPARKEDGWVNDPFSPEIRDGKIYGRGTSDDKGPLLCAYYAAKLFHELHPEVKKKIRVIFGCNEERGSSCVKYYFTKMPKTEIAFTPDAEFPVIYGEKAHVGFEFTKTEKDDVLISLDGGTVSNVVPSKCTAVLKGTDEMYRDAFDNFLEENKEYTGEYEVKNGNTVVTVIGKPAHASTPHLGLNANIGIARYLVKFMDNDAVNFMVNHLYSYDGEGLDIDYTGELGPLTLNFGLLKMNEGKFYMNLDLRVPHEIDNEQMCQNVSQMASGYGMETKYTYGNALIIDRESKLIKALDAAYKEFVPDGGDPMAIGGGTYAKSVNNCAAFGPAFPGENTKIHDANEFMDLESLCKATKIYYRAIERIML